MTIFQRRLFLSGIGALLVCTCLSVTAGLSESLLHNWQREGGIHAGLFDSDKEIGRDINKTGAPGEELIGELSDGVFVEMFYGMSKSQIAINANLWFTPWSSLDVHSDLTGADFPNHSEGGPWGLGIDMEVRPLGVHKKRGLCPYVVAGIGTAWLSVDLDNAGGQSSYSLNTHRMGGGFRYYHRDNNDDKFLEMRYLKLKFGNDGPINSFKANVLTVAINWSF